jgi:hypothetical protein
VSHRAEIARRRRAADPTLRRLLNARVPAACARRRSWVAGLATCVPRPRA